MNSIILILSTKRFEYGIFSGAAESKEPHSKLWGIRGKGAPTQITTRPLSSRQQADGYSAEFFINGTDFKKISVIAVILTNLIPIYGVLFLGWQVFPVMLLFWIENVIIGVSNVFKMIFASPDNFGQWFAKLLIIPFFCFHYGLFTMVHGIFVFVLFSGFLKGGPWPVNANDILGIIANQQLGWAILALILSHTLSFVTNYIGKGEYKKSTLSDLMVQPYSRVIILHVTILLSGFMVMELGSPMIGLVLVIISKTFVDIKTHLKQHGNVTTPKSETGVIAS